MSDIIITVTDGIPEVESNPADMVTIIDWDRETDDWDYDTCAEMTHSVLDSDLDGPTQFKIIKRLAEKFEEFTG